jgi:hypothetical protein
LLLAIAAAQLIRSSYTTKPLAPAVFAGVIGLLFGVPTTACLLPAWRASRVQRRQSRSSLSSSAILLGRGTAAKEEDKRAFHELRRFWPALFAFAMVALVLGPARADLNPAAFQYKLPNQIEWKDTPIGAKMAVMHGDPDKPGPYIVLIKWGPHQMSRPHYHPNDRFITVLSGNLVGWVPGASSIRKAQFPCRQAALLPTLPKESTMTAPRMARPSSRSSARVQRQ